MANNTLPVPTEAQEQITLFEWASLQRGRYPELDLLFHVPNGGSRNKIEAARLQAQGVKSGVPDLCLPVPRGRFHGLYIELKRKRGSKIAPEQTAWLEELMKQGYSVAVCYGWEAATEIILKYLEGKDDGKKTNGYI